jgi:hypothetical protein
MEFFYGKSGCCDPDTGSGEKIEKEKIQLKSYNKTVATKTKETNRD